MNDPRSSKTSAAQPAAPYTAADLPIDGEGRFYHLQVKPGQVAPDILIVGDPGRAEFCGSNFLREVEFEHEHRGLVTITGTAEITGARATIITPLRTTLATSGIGTGSLEIVLNELVALHEINFETRRRKPEFPRLHILRLGTSGALQASTALGTLIITSYVIGLDSTGLFYETPFADEHCERIEHELQDVMRSGMRTDSRFYGSLHPYVARAEPNMVKALMEAAEILGAPARLGLTASCSGFFAPQGRDIGRVKPSLPDLDELLAEYDPRVGNQRIENMEMEASYLLHLMGGLGHWAGAICPVIANRRKDTFDPHYQEAITRATQVALLALATLRSRHPDVRMR